MVDRFDKKNLTEDYNIEQLEKKGLMNDLLTGKKRVKAV